MIGPYRMHCDIEHYIIAMHVNSSDI